MSTRSTTIDVTAMTQILNANIRDELDIRKYRRLLGGLQIKRDGPGGMVTWTVSREYHVDDHERARQTLYGEDLYRHFDDPDRMIKNAEKDIRTAFTTMCGGQQLQFVKTPTPSFNSLPDKVRNNICRRFVASQNPIRTNLGTDQRIPLGLLYVNKDTHTKWQKVFVKYSDFHLNMSSTEAVFAFSDSDALARLLQKPFHFLFPLDDEIYDYRIFRYPGEEEAPIEWHSTIIEDNRCLCTQKVHVRLDFDLTRPVAPESFCVSILPLIMATSSTEGMHGAYITVTHPEATTGGLQRAEHRIRLFELRCAVTKALRNFLLSRASDTDILRPEIWINGLGNVVEVKAVQGPQQFEDAIQQLESAEDSGPQTVKDLRFRKLSGEKYHPYAFSSWFPFENSAQAALDYLLWLVECEANGWRPNHMLV